MNAVFLIIDSLDYTRCQISGEDLLPNIRRRAENGISCENMYSQAPYTEAATMALYCGQNTLDYRGYIERFNNAQNTLMEVVNNAGYETYFNSYQPQCFPSSLRRGVDHIMYNRGFDNVALWPYRFEHFAEKNKNGFFTDIDTIQLKRILADNFSEWLRFLRDLEVDDYSVKMIKHLNHNYDINHVRELVIEEERKYKCDEESYIMDILNMGEKHPIFCIPYFLQKDYKLSDSSMNYYNGEIASFVKKIRIINALQNIIFNNDVIKAWIKAIRLKIKKDINGYNQQISLIRNAMVMGKNNQKYGELCHSLKGQPSFNEHILHFFNWLDKRDNYDRPFFATIHVDDIHYPEMFFSYDSDNIGILSEEIDVSKDCLKKRKINSKGTISLDLSLRYADLKCEQLFKGLECRGIMDDTIVFITADHGFSYSGYPIRNKFVNTFFLENFKIPFYIIGSEIRKKRDYAIRSSVDIPSSICSILGIEAPDSFVGKSILQQDEEERIITIEYCGGGCPDIDGKQLMIAAFDNDFMVAGLFFLKDGFNIDNITEIYDLQHDPLQKKNLVKNVEVDLIEKYLDKIQKRVIEIQNTNNEVILSFDV